MMRFLLFVSVVAATAAHAQTSTIAATAPKPVLLPAWEWNGDLRYRSAESRESLDENRRFHQLRVRLGTKADVNEDVRAILRLATGTSAISTNQTLGDSKDPGMTRRSFGLDQAYMDWRSSQNTHVWAGRTANPFWSPGKTATIFDSDLSFEGAAVKWEPKAAGVSGFLNFGAFIISENFAAPDDVVDTGLMGFQAGWSGPGLGGTWTLHASNHHFLNIWDKPITTIDKDAKTDSYSYPFDRYRGNTVVPNDPLLPADQRKYFFLNQYVLTSLGAEWKTASPIGDLTMFIETVRNDMVADQGLAREIGVSWKWGRSVFVWADVLKESDSVVGAFTDSDVNGGGTDNRGTRFHWTYTLSPNSQLALNIFKAKRGISSVERDGSLTQMDVIVSF